MDWDKDGDILAIIQDKSGEDQQALVLDSELDLFLNLINPCVCVCVCVCGRGDLNLLGPFVSQGSQTKVALYADVTQ